MSCARYGTTKAGCLSMARMAVHYSLVSAGCFVKPVDVKLTQFIFLAVGLSLQLLCGSIAQAQQHRATRLGNPATRFAPPLFTVEDLRSRFRDEKLQPDFAAVLNQWGWKGRIEDMRRAALTGEVVEWQIPVGERMPFMSSRENGRAICLRDVLWAGKEPAPAYAFLFTSNGQRYRCVTPKACSNFFLYDLGPDVIPTPKLVLQCNAPPREFTGRATKVCLTLHNTGTGPESDLSISLAIPAGVKVVGATGGGTTLEDRIVWDIGTLGTNASREVCAELMSSQAGVKVFASTARGAATSLTNNCETKFIGVFAMVVEVIDVEDPVLVGKEVTYIITAMNQGDQVLTNVRVNCVVPNSQEYVMGSGTTAVRANNQAVTMEPVPTLEGKATATWRIVTKALRADDARFKVQFISDQFDSPINEDEATRLY